MLESMGASFSPRTTRVQTPMAAQSSYIMGNRQLGRPVGPPPTPQPRMGLSPSARMNSLARSTSSTAGAVISA
jgi:hypothetical protein